MLSIAHTTTGAYIATTIQNPVISFPIILASHYIEDFIIHWDAGTGLSSGKKKPLHAFQHEIIDLIVSFVLVFVLFQSHTPQINYLAWYGAIVSLIPDFLEAPKNFFKWEPAMLKPFNAFHSKFHNSTKNILIGLTPQLLIILLIIFLTQV